MILIYYAIEIYILILIATAVLSWFPIDPYGPMGKVKAVLAQITDPLLVPLRRLIPPVGGFDLSLLVLVIILGVVQQYIGRML